MQCMRCVSRRGGFAHHCKMQGAGWPRHLACTHSICGLATVATGHAQLVSVRLFVPRQPHTVMHLPHPAKLHHGPLTGTAHTRQSHCWGPLCATALQEQGAGIAAFGVAAGGLGCHSGSIRQQLDWTGNSTPAWQCGSAGIKSGSGRWWAGTGRAQHAQVWSTAHTPNTGLVY